ncbi:1329_t:CDS:2 [Paraglomus occultum]|uniref:1329_t:CDS:1 n=1 Tax=Paraglomus occultum TaxID=144539 RepID=A0A9N9DGY0_9GLOM|nr:1329_t:CDS:2 [Paraglomus occultum]
MDASERKFIAQYARQHPDATDEEIHEEYLKTQQGKEGVLEPSVDSTESEEEEIVRVAFDRPFQDPSDLSERFMAFIDKCSYEYETTKDYYAPYATLIQASGTGKSKLLKNFAENRMTFENERDVIVTYLAYVCACCKRLEEFNGSCKEWFDEHINKKSQVDFWKNVEYRMSDIMRGLMKNPTDSKMTEWVTNYLDGGKLMMWESSVNCLFAFDEARSLLLRRGLNYLSHFICWTLDMNTMNTAFEKALTLQESEDPRHFFQYGRPLWGALLSPSSDAEGFNPECIIELAMDKLIGGKSFIHWKTEAQTKISIMEALAIFGPRLCIDIVPQSRFTSHLIANYLYICLNISEDRECITTSMPTEPVLAEAAARMMNDPNVSLAELINQLSSALKKGVVEAGYHGELTARLLLLRAWDDCIKKKHPRGADVGNDYSRFVTMDEFLKSLLAESIYRKIEDRLKEQVKFTGTKFGEAYIRFTHFINITYTPSRKIFGDALIRGVAFSCKRNQRGVDIIIPIYIGTIHEKLNEDHISYILIQVKNWTTDSNGDNYLLSATALLSPAYIGVEKLPHMPFLSLYLQLGATTEFVDVQLAKVKARQTRQINLCKRKIEEVLKDYQADDDTTRDEFIKKIRIDGSKDVSDAEITAFRECFQVPLALFGLSSNIYGCLEQFMPVPATSSSTTTKDLTSNFKQLLTAWVDPTMGKHPEKVEIIKRMVPFVYEME